MTDKKKNSPEDEAQDDGQPRAARFSMSKVVLTIAGLALGSAAILMTMSPRVAPPGRVELAEAFVHGPVTQVGIAQDARIARLHVGLGDEVRSDDLVAVLENDTLRARVAEAQANVGRLEAELARARVADEVARDLAQSALVGAEADIAAARARLEAARGERALAQSNLARQAELADRGVVPRAQLDRAREAAQAAEALVTRRSAELAEAQSLKRQATAEAERARLRAAERDVLRARIAEARAARDRAEAREARSRIRAGQDGIVVDVSSRAGSSVRPNDPIVSIWDRDRVWMRAWVSEAEVARIATGDHAHVEIDALPDEILEGRVNRILVARDGRERLLPGQPVSPLLPEEAQFAVHVAIDPTDAQRAALLPGMSGNVRIVTDRAAARNGPTAKLMQFLDGLWGGGRIRTAESDVAS